jgi:hypothetical protein
MVFNKSFDKATTDFTLLLSKKGSGGGGGSGLPALGDVIVDPFDATKNFITDLQRFTVDSASYDVNHENFFLTWTPNPPGPHRWTIADPLLQGPRIIISGPDFASPTDHTIVVNTVAGHPVTINLPDPGTSFLQSGKQIIIVDGNGGAAVDTITISGNGHTINGAATVTITNARGAKTVTWINGANGWLITAVV